MALSTKEAPVYGGGTLVIEFTEETKLNPDSSYYVVYEGSKLRHVTTARKHTSQTLHSVIPGRNEEEDVNLSVLEFQNDRKVILTASSFHFYTDGTFYLAQFLVESVFNTEALDDFELIKSDDFNLADEELSTLDKRLSCALASCDFPEWWSLLGSDSTTEPLQPRESLLHFAARLGLYKVAAFFLNKSGSEQVVDLANKNGELPRDVARQCEHDNLAELLSQYNIHRSLPQGRWLQTVEGLIHTQETGDVTLTSKFETHKRTIEEDIRVLQTIQKQLENKDTDISRQWQTDWPTDNTQYTDVNTNDKDSLDDKYQAICDKVQELPNVLTLESISDDALVDSNNVMDSADHVDMNEDHNVPIEAGSSPRQQMSEGEEELEGIMEGSVSALRGYNEHLQRIRQKSTVFNKILEQPHRTLLELRKGNLARFSSSCPSLDVDCRNSPLPVIDEGDLCKSMVDLADENVGENAATPTSIYSGDVFSSGGDINDSADNIHIIVGGSTVDSSSDYGLQTQEYDQFLKDYYGGNVPQVRKRSASPVVKRAGSVGEQLGGEDKTMLIHGNKSICLPQDIVGSVNNTFHSQDNILAGNDGVFSAGTEGLRRTLHSTGDMDRRPEQSDKADGESGMSEDSAFSSGRGHTNKARYSADIESLMRNMKAHHSGSSLDKMSGSTHSTGSGSESETLAMPHGKITKAFSMSSIPAATNGDKSQKGSNYKDTKHSHFHPDDEILEEDYIENNNHRQKTKISLTDFLNDSSNFSNSSTNFSSKSRDKDKEDKKRKTSVFSRFHSSYRKKNKDKDGKNKSSTHRFVSVSFSNSTTCDVCHKQLMNKPAFRCQICLVNVHENSCKEQITACDKFKPKNQVPRQSSTESENVPGSADRNNAGVSNLRPSYSFKDNSTRAQSSYIGASTQPIPVTNVQQDIQPETIVMRKKKSTSQSASAQLQRRSLPTPSHPIAEEHLEAENVSRLDLGQSNITDTISHSIESLDEVDSVQEVRYDDVELCSLDTEEPETWSETVDKKVLKKMNPKDIKRQDTIWELIQTERQFCKRLKTLQIFFRDGLLNELRLQSDYVERMFPQLDDLISIHMTFLHQLQDLQNRRQDRFVEEIGPVLKEQFSGDLANKMKSSYGIFCSQHLEAVQLYKDLLAREKKFQNFIKQKSTHHLCRRREVPDFILLITQRPTKYPTLIQGVIKNTKEKKDRECLIKALDLSKDVLQSVDRQVAKAELAMKLKYICNRLDSRSMAIHRGKKFKKSDIESRTLLHEGYIGWKNARGKTVDVLAVVLNDVLLFLQENNQKYSFFSQDNKEGVVSLFNLLVREKRDTRDTIGIYLISQNKQSPEMYEVVFNTTTEMQKWAKILRSAIEQCPEEVEEEVQTAADEERIRQERRAERTMKIQEQLHQHDKKIQECCDRKNKLLSELHAIYNELDDQPHSRPSSRDFDDVTSPAENAVVLQAAIQEVSMAASQLTNMLQGNGTNLSRSVSSVGEHTSNTFSSLPIPKRAETFGGFDNHDVNRDKLKGSYTSDMSDGNQSIVNNDPVVSDLDSSQYSDISTGTGHLKNLDESEVESGRGSIQSSTTSMTLQMSSLPHDQSNIVHLIGTLNNIVHLTASQGTAVETLRAQLAEANEKISKLSSDVHDNKHKSGYRHNQLEELRNLQGVIQKEKEEWELKKTKENRDMEQERAQLDEMKRNLDKQENDLRQQKEEFNKKREVLQRQMDLLRQSGQLPKDTSLSDLLSSEQTTDGSELKSGFVPGHRRSASAESFNSSAGDSKKNISNSSKENNFRSDTKSMSKQSFSFSSKQNVPVHLLSATNEQKIGSKNVQQLPSKLLGNVSTSPQLVTQSGPKNNSGSLGQSVGNQSSPGLVSEQGSHSDSGSHLGHSASMGQLGNQGTTQVGSSVTVPIGNRQSNRPKPSSVVASLSGVLKLSEKGDKKGKSSSNSSHSGDKGARSSPPQSNETSSQRPKSGQPNKRNPSINHKPQKSDSDVIYF